MFRSQMGWALACGLFPLLLAAQAGGGDWPNYRGPNRDGISAETPVWPADITANEVWRASLGAGYSQVAVSGGKVYTMGWVPNQDTVFCFDEASTGNDPATLWDESYLCGSVAYTGPRATPTVDGNEVYTFSHEGRLSCFDKDDGTPLWNNSVNWGRPGSWNYGSSVLVEGDLVIVNASREGVAFNNSDPRSAAGHSIAWPVSSTGTAGYATPVPFTWNSQPMVAIFGGNRVSGVNPTNGNTLWYYSWTQGMADPIISGDNVWISTGYGKGCTVLQLRSDGGACNTLWTPITETTEIRNKMNCSVLWDGYVYGVDEGGELRCVQFTSGTRTWSSPVSFGTEAASVALANANLASPGDAELIVMSRSGDLVIVQADPAQYTELHRYDNILGGNTWTCPVLANGKLYVRNSAGLLICYDVSGTAGVPAITSASTASGTTGVPFTYQITATDSPTSYDATVLPADLSVDTSTGVISGTPAAAGVSSVSLSATNATGTGMMTLTLTVTDPPPPAITSAATASGTEGVPFTYQITATGSPTSYGETGLPANLSVNTSTGLISGTPAAAGTSSVGLSATNATGTGTKTLTLTITAPPAPTITSASTASGTTGVPFTYQITATNSPTSYDATGLPADLSVDTSTGVISGTPAAAGTSSVSLSATNAGGTGTMPLTLTIQEAPRLDSITVSPASWTMTATTGKEFTATALDQFGAPIAVTVNWSVSGAGSVSPITGMSTTFTAGATGGVVTVTASSGGFWDSATVTVEDLADSDLDGMDDAWEMLHFGDLTHDGKADTDGDGASDYEEFLAGTNPSHSGGVGTGFSCGGPEAGAVSWLVMFGAALALLASAGRASKKDSAPEHADR